MLYQFPIGTTARVVVDYERPYHDPVAVRAGDPVVADPERTLQTDLMGWTWCKGPDGREGWVPNGWIERADDGWHMRRDYSALELTVRTGETITLHYSESGFVHGRNAAGEQGWIPDAVLELIPSNRGA